MRLQEDEAKQEIAGVPLPAGQEQRLRVSVRSPKEQFACRLRTMNYGSSCPTAAESDPFVTSHAECGIWEKSTFCSVKRFNFISKSGLSQ